VPDVLREPIAACLAKRPEDRPTASELGGMLGTVVADGRGWLPPAVAALAADAEGPTVPERSTKVAAPPPSQAEQPGLSRRALLISLGIIGATSGGAFALAMANQPTDPQPGPPAPLVRWTVPFGSNTSRYTGWAVDDSSVYAHSEDGVLRAVDSATGAERWTVPGWTQTAAQLEPVGGEYLVVGTDSAVAAIEVETGRRRWEVARTGSAVAGALTLSGVALTRPVVANGIVLVMMPERIVAVDLVTGGRLWTSEPHFLMPFAHVAAYDGVCFAAVDRTVVARDLQSGRILWTSDVDIDGDSQYGPRHPSRLVAGGGAVVAGYQGAPALAVDTGSGQLRWRMPLDLSGLLGDMDFVGDVLVARTEGSVRGLDPATGDELWAVRAGGIIEDVVRGEGIVYFADVDGPTCAHDAVTGAQLWAVEPSQRFGTPVAARGRDAYIRRSQSAELQAVTTNL
jgi:outer membrane protein assembly factor BamB